MRHFVSLAATLLLTATPALRAADGSVSFEGSHDYISVPNFHNANVSGEVTVEFWAKTNTAAIQQAAFMLFPDQPANRFMASISYFNGNTYWDCGDINGTGPGRLSTPNPAGSVGNWTHYAFVSSASGGFMKIYVNGVEVASKTGTVSAFKPTANGDTGYALHIGGSSSFFLDGSLDEFRVWNTVRTPWEIQRDLGANLTGNEDGLRLYYKFDEDSGSTIVNSATATGSTHNGTLFNGATNRSAPARLTVSNTNDSGAGSLRYAVAEAALAAGASYITFDPALSGQTITLDSRIYVFDATGPVTIDASSLHGGLTLDGSGGAAEHAIFYVDPSPTNLSLHGLTLTGAKASAIDSSGKLTLRRCTLFGNSSAGNGGAIYNRGDTEVTALLSQCTLFGNSAANGGAIYQVPPSTTNDPEDKLTLEHCTLSGNSASTAGGAIVSTGTFIPFGSTFGSALANLDNCIVAGNSAPSDPNLSGAFGGSTNVINGDPLLSPLGYYGGSTMTMRPLPGSPAIDAGIASLSTDQRGFARSRDGNGAGGAQPDIGAVELNPVTVTTTADEDNTPASGGTGISLREAVRSNQADIFFAPTLNGQTIRLTLGTEIELDKDVVLDASNLPAGLTVAGNPSGALQLNRLFTVFPGRSVAMTGLTLTNGAGQGVNLNGSGGAILNLGKLILLRCTLFGNQAGSFAASGSGGAVYTTGELSATQCTFYDNRALESGGAIMATIGANVNLVHCTLSANATYSGNGGGISSNSFLLRAAYSLIWGNTTGTQGLGSDVFVGAGPVEWRGANFVGNFINQGTGTVAGTTPSTANPLLGQLGNYGGPTPTLVPKLDSPVINAAVGSTITRDQRGSPVAFTVPDSGAVERKGRETLTVTTTADELTPNNAQTSLREAITDGAAENIVCAPALSGGTITLEGSRGEIAITRGVTIDASSLPKGLTIDGGPGTNRILNITSTARVTLSCLTLTGGEAPGGRGGAILTAAGTDLTLSRCTLTGNTSQEGGAIFSLGRLALERCTFNGNSGGYGGALQCLGQTDINHCTISGNHGSILGGGIFNKSTTEAAPLTVTNSIVANNTSPNANGEDIYNQLAQLVFEGVCIVVDYYLDANSNVTSVNGASLFREADAAFLAPFGDYGGPAKTMPPLPGSRAVGKAVGSTITTDQRGRPIVGVADLGACEGSNYIYFPIPSQAAVISNSTPTLDWRWVGASGATFAVFIARTSGDLGDPITSGSTASIFDIPQSEFLGGHTYYWRADTTVNGVTYTGQEFSFTNNMIDKGGRRDTGTTIQRALATAAANPGPDTIQIGQNLDGQTLGVSEITVEDTGGVTIDATSLPHGAVLDGEGLNRLFAITAGSSLTLRGLTIRGGTGAGSDTSTHGGAFFNRGNLTLDRCTLTGNTAPYGGAIFNETGGILILTQCTLAGNGISPDTLEAGAIYNRGTATLTHCTIAGNTAVSFGGIYNDMGKTLTLAQCIIGGNSGTLGGDMRNNGTVIRSGANLAGSAVVGDGAMNGTGTIITANPLLAPLGDYDGPAQTVALMPGSPALNAATGSTITSDQRGFPSWSPRTSARMKPAPWARITTPTFGKPSPPPPPCRNVPPPSTSTATARPTKPSGSPSPIPATAPAIST